MVDISTISAVYYTMAATSVVIGVIFAVLQLRNLVKARQTDLVIRLYSTFGSKEFQEASKSIITLKLKDCDNYVKKYGWSEIIQVGTLFEGIGVLLRRKLIDIDLVDDLFSEPIRTLWKKMKPIIESERKRRNQPRIFEWFEYLSNEMQKREESL